MNTNYFQKKILITGATGSIGSAVIFELLNNYRFKVVRAMSNDENSLFELGQKLNENQLSFNKFMQTKKVRLLHGDIRSYQRCLEVTRDINIVIHVAAMKHVSICEYNPLEAIMTNVQGTKNMCKASIVNKVEKFIFISTDKAVNPQTVMGSSKLKAEKVVLKSDNVSSKKKTIFSCIRFGNILGSRGSVLQIFKRQIAANRNLNITDSRMTRFFIDIDFAAKKILESLKVSRGGEIFVINSMKSFKILDLAQALVSFYKKKIKVNFVGYKKYEKIHEELISKKELKYAIIKNDLIIINKKFNCSDNLKNYLGKIINNQEIMNSKNSIKLNQKEIIAFLKDKKLL
jgi:nucleoside-diphosphate-sugar epimerase